MKDKALSILIPNDLPVARPSYVDSRLTKVPDWVYQNMCDMAQRFSEEEAKSKILEYLIEFYQNTKPGRVILNFIDLSAKEAEAIRKHNPQFHDIDWGMYVLLADGYYDVPDINSLLLNSQQNTIENGNKKSGS